MNTQHPTAITGLKEIAEALVAVAEAGDNHAGPETVEQSRLKFEKNFENARARFGEYFASLIQEQPVATPRQKEQAQQGRDLDQ